jgi:uncharacterized protein YlzI (FlbEa/FlbD family)
MNTYKVTYLSGQSILTKGNNIEQVRAEAEATIAKFAKGRPWVGIKSVEFAK